LDEIVCIGLGLSDKLAVSLTVLEVLNAAGYPASYGLTVTNSFTHVDNTVNLDSSKSAVRDNGSAKVVNQIISCKRNLIDASTGSFSSKKAYCSNIILFTDVYIDYWSQGMSNAWMDLNRLGKIDSNYTTAFVNSYLAYRNGQL